jgi:hypothetical protein
MAVYTHVLVYHLLECILTVLNTKGTEFTQKLRTDMVSPSQKLLLEAHSHQFLTQNSREGFWRLRGIPREGNKHET